MLGFSSLQLHTWHVYYPKHCSLGTSNLERWSPVLHLSETSWSLNLVVPVCSWSEALPRCPSPCPILVLRRLELFTRSAVYFLGGNRLGTRITTVLTVILMQCLWPENVHAALVTQCLAPHCVVHSSSAHRGAVNPMVGNSDICSVTMCPGSMEGKA